MPSITTVISARNAGVRLTGLTLTWILFKKLSDNTNLSQPSFSEIGNGMYKFTYDPAATGAAVGQIDLDSTNALTLSAADRYKDVTVTLAELDMGEVVPTTNTAQTVGDSLNAARAQGFGSWSAVGSSLTLFGPDNTTPVHTFVLNDPNNPSSRT